MDDSDKTDELYSGVWLLKDNNDKDSEPYFGTVCAFGPAKSTGTVRLSFRDKHVRWKTDEFGDVVIELSEQRARQLADQVVVSIVRLKHLRDLKHLGLLAGEDDNDG